METQLRRDSPRTQSRRAALVRVIASVSVFAVAQGLSYPLFTFLMQKQGMPTGLIGLSAAMTPIGLVVSAPLVPRAVTLLGAQRLAVGAALAAAALFLLIGILQNWFAWLLLRFLIGFAINPLYILSEVWMLALAPAERRGRLMGVFNAIAGGGYAAGPLALTLVGSEGWPPLAVGAAGFLGCATLIALTAGGLDGFHDDGRRVQGVWSFWAVAPALLFAVVTSAATQQSVYSLLPVFGAAYGLAEPDRALMVAALSLGNIVLQLPLGFGAERFGARPMIAACVILNCTCALLLTSLVGSPAVWVVLLVMGGAGYGVYTMALVELGDRFTGSTLVAGTAAFAMMWGVGGIAGPPASGIAMELAGPAGLPAVIVALGTTLLALLVYRAMTRRE